MKPDDDWSQTPEELLRLLESMMRIRLVEEKISSAYPSGVIRTPVHLCIGQEATPVAVARCLKSGDLVFSHHRSHGHYLGVGGDLRALFAELLGRVDGCCSGLGGSQHLTDVEAGFVASAPILAGTVPVAAGYAWSLKAKNSESVCVSYIGDAVIEEGVFHETLNFAATHCLPIVFVCENNFYSVHAHISVRQPSRPITDVIRGHGIPTVCVDGNDVVAMLKPIGDAIGAVRAGSGPYFVEAVTYRTLEHVGPSTDWHLGYRQKSEGDEWAQRDPILRLESRILSRDSRMGRVRIQEIRAAIEDELEKAWLLSNQSSPAEFEFAKGTVFPRSRVVHD